MKTEVSFSNCFRKRVKISEADSYINNVLTLSKINFWSQWKEKKVNFLMSKLWRQIKELQIYLRPFLASVLDAVKKWTSCPSRYIHENENRIYWIDGCVDSASSPDLFEKRKIPLPFLFVSNTHYRSRKMKEKYRVAKTYNCRLIRQWEELPLTTGKSFPTRLTSYTHLIQSTAYGLNKSFLSRSWHWIFEEETTEELILNEGITMCFEIKQCNESVRQHNLTIYSKIILWLHVSTKN